jgi:PIN domain nuclease of toxin-antitoxin system
LENITVNSIPEHCNKLGIKQISLTPSDAISFSRLPLFENHRDPFDRMLIWQAIQNNYTLISRDKLFAPYEQYGLKLLW